jgi:glycosyltransferase involved in cell wall biosynthesis
MKIAMLSHLASVSAPTGAERSLALLAHGLSAGRHEVSVTAPGRWSLTGELEQAGVSVTPIPVRSCWLVQWEPQPMWLQAARGLRFAAPDPGARLLRRWLAGLAPDVVHVNCLPHLRGAAAAKALGLPVVWHLREILPAGRRRRWLAGRLRRDATAIIAVSDAVAGWLREEGLGDRVEVVYNGVGLPPDSVDQETARRRFGLPPDATVIGLFGQLVAHKGALDFVRAAHAVFADKSDLHYLIAGDGPASFARQLEREIAAGAARNRIHVVPPQPEIWELMAAVDVLALTTLWPDPLPRVVMEGMAAGRPVVAYDGGGVPEMVVDGETGLLCAAGDVDGLAVAIGRMAGDSDLRQRTAEAGRRRSRVLFSVEGHLDRMESALVAASTGR